VSAVLVPADVLRAHGHLAAIDAQTADEGLLRQVLSALMTGAGAARGVAIDPAHPGAAVTVGFEPRVSALAEVASCLVRSRGDALPADLVRTVFEDAGDPRAIPLTADDETLAVMLLDVPPADPLGFASVTAHAAALLDRVRMSQRVREADFELKYRVWELESLYDVGLSIAGTLDLESLADDVLFKSVSLLNARKGTLLVRDASHDRILIKAFGEQLVTGDMEFELPAQIIVANCRADRPPLLKDSPAEKLLATSIVSDGKPLGILVVADKENRAGGIDDWCEADKRIISLFGNQAAIALENARLHRDALEKERIEREIELAASIQKTILPAGLPSVPGLELAGGNRPTRQVGGDYYDVFPLPNGKTALCVADVSGKGVPAALLVSTLHACLYLSVADLSHDLPRLVARINRHLSRFSSTRKFVTLFFAVYDANERTLEYVNAGHNPGLVLRESGVSELPSSGMPIGMFAKAVHTAATISLVPGDILALYSDGITEAMDAQDEEFGMQRLTQLLVDGRYLTPATVSGNIFSAVDVFTRGVAQYDDQTVLVAKVV